MSDSASRCPVLNASEFWQRSRGSIVLDVRSPSEFRAGHLPAARSLPLFDDQERAEVGTIYKNSGRQDAVLRGLTLAGKKLGSLALAARSLTPNGVVFVHCWRGGMRSQSVAWLLETAGLKPRLLEGGYKSFRHLARASFSTPWQLRVVSGLTGVGKTRVLERLTAAGEQVLDLEALAHHRGSAFGAIGQPEQPTTEQFENNLFEQLAGLDPERIVWLEDEGNRLGTVVVPPEFVGQIRSSPAVFLQSPTDVRVANLMQDYGDLAPERLVESIEMIRRRLGPQHADHAIQCIRHADIEQAVRIVLDYYDRTYMHAVEKMPAGRMHRLDIQQPDDTGLVDRLLAWRDSID